MLPNFAPVFVTLAGFLLFGERFSRLFLAGMAIAIAGAVILMGESFDLGPRHLLGDALALATALFYAGYIVVRRPAARAARHGADHGVERAGDLRRCCCRSRWPPARA